MDFLVDYLSRIIVNASPEEYIDGLARSVTLLKAIKDGIIPRPHWEPSDEQIIALRWVLNNVPYNKHKEEISGLLDQIKEL